MKSKLLLIVMCSIVLCACSKLPYGDIGKEDIGKDEEIILTENNYIYEGELLKFVLNKDIDSLEARIKELKSLTGKDLTLEDELEETNKLLSELVALNKTVPSFSDILDELGRRGPNIPRPPRPDVLPNELRYILGYNLESILVQGSNENNQVVLESDNGYLSPLPGTEGYIQIQEVNVNELIVNENITLSIERKDKNGMNFIYSISTIVQK